MDPLGLVPIESRPPEQERLGAVVAEAARAIAAAGCSRRPPEVGGALDLKVRVADRVFQGKVPGTARETRVQGHADLRGKPLSVRNPGIATPRSAGYGANGAPKSGYELRVSFGPAW